MSLTAAAATTCYVVRQTCQRIQEEGWHQYEAILERYWLVVCIAGCCLWVALC